MNINTIGVVISREYQTRVKKKSFLVTTFVVPVLFAALCCVPALIMLFNKDEEKIFAVVDQSGIVMDALESNKEVQFAPCANCNLDSLKAQFEDLPYAAILHISPIDSSNSVAVNTFSVKPVGVSVLSSIEGRIEKAVQDYRIEQYGLDQGIFDAVKADIDIKTYTIDKDGNDKLSNANVYMIISLVLGIIIFMFVTMFSSSVMQSVIEEKQSKIVEVLLSSVDAVSLMFGKIIGVALVALTQFLLWIVLTAAIVSGVFAFVGKDKISGVADNAEMMEQMSGIPGGEALSPEPLSEVQEIVQTLGTINIPLILAAFFVFFIFGYLLYASMFAAIGSAVENAEDSQQLQTPLTIPLMIAYFIALYSWNAPDSALAVWGSMIPFTSPIVMLARVPFGVPAWQMLLSISILVATFALMAWLSAKIYRIGILTSGKKATWKDLYKWLKQK